MHINPGPWSSGKGCESSVKGSYDMKESWKVTGKERRRNSQLAFSMVSNSLWEIFMQGGESDPPGIRVTSIGVSARSSLFSNMGWSRVYQYVICRLMFLLCPQSTTKKEREREREIQPITIDSLKYSSIENEFIEWTCSSTFKLWFQFNFNHKFYFNEIIVDKCSKNIVNQWNS